MTPLDLTECGIQGKLCTILAWYWGDDNRWHPPDYKELAHIIGLVPAFVAGDSLHYYDAWLIMDALMNYPELTPELENFYDRADKMCRTSTVQKG